MIEHGKGFEEVGGGAAGSVFEAAVPVLEQRLQVAAELGEFAEAGFDRRELLFGEGPYPAAGRRSAFPLTQNDRQLRERKTEGERSPHEQDARECGLRIDAVIGGRARGFRQNAHPLIVTEGVGADARAPRQFSGGDAHAGHYPARNAFQGQEAFF